MNNNQLELYYTNILTLADTIHSVGGSAHTVMLQHRSFVETLSRNGVKVVTKICDVRREQE